MLETNCVGDSHKISVTVFAILVTNIHYLFTLAQGCPGTKIKDITNVEV